MPGHYTTGVLDASVIDLQVLVEPSQERAGDVSLAPVFTFQPDLTKTAGNVALLDAEGRYLWATSAGFVPRARLSPDGDGVLFLSQETRDQVYTSRLVQVSWTGEVLWEQEVPLGQRDLAILDGDTVALLHDDQEYVEAEGASADGDSIVLVHRDGSIETTWSVFDQLGPGWCAGEHAFAEDWSHANFLTWVPEQGLLLIVLRCLPAIVAVDPYTGEQAWILSETCGDFENTGEGPLARPLHGQRAAVGRRGRPGDHARAGAGAGPRRHRARRTLRGPGRRVRVRGAGGPVPVKPGAPLEQARGRCFVRWEPRSG